VVGDDATDQPFQVYRIVREHLVVENCLGNGDSIEAGLMLAIVFRQNDLQVLFSPNRNNSAYKWRSPQLFRDIHSKQQSTNEKNDRDVLFAFVEVTQELVRISRW
jgi:hypothetical protein